MDAASADGHIMMIIPSLDPPPRILGFTTLLKMDPKEYWRPKFRKE